MDPSRGGRAGCARSRQTRFRASRANPDGVRRATLSGGICALGDDVDATELYRRADNALLAAKHAGRDRVFIYDEDWTEPESAGNLLGGPGDEGARRMTQRPPGDTSRPSGHRLL